MKNTDLKSSLLFITTVIIIAFISSCKPVCERHPDSPDCAGENEIITTIQLIVSDSSTGTIIDTFEFKDTDGNGLPEVFDTIRLDANSTYKIALQFLNESINPSENLNQEIIQEKNDHLIVYQNLTADINFTYIDFDDNLLPLGLQMYWRTGAVSEGYVQITLRHQPGSKDGTAAPGDTDVSVKFPILIR